MQRKKNTLQNFFIKIIKFKIINLKKTKEFTYKHDNLSVDYKKFEINKKLI